MQKYSKISKFLGGSESKAQKGTAQSGSAESPLPPLKGGRLIHELKPSPYSYDMAMGFSENFST